MLWAAYESRTLTAGSGISAMPSLHVATSLSFAILGWKTSRLVGVLLGMFAAIILIGSVHLGWHYAVDGYLSIALTGLIWWAVGRWLRQNRPAATLNRPR
jgi:membrane-associated phospholipid phosphatase